jgi:hypothetical protein
MLFLQPFTYFWHKFKDDGTGFTALSVNRVFIENCKTWAIKNFFKKYFVLIPYSKIKIYFILECSGVCTMKVYTALKVQYRT